MKRLLLDTHALLWWLADDSTLGESTRAMIASHDNVIFVSAASIWEIAIKKTLGKLIAPDGLDTVLEQEGFEALPIEVFHAEQAGALPAHHRDPFDRMERGGIRFSSAGENLSMGYPNVFAAHWGLMNSKGHRDNILQKRFTQADVGVAFRDNAPYFTINFRTP